MALNSLPIGAAGGSSAGNNIFLESTRTNVIVLQDLEGLCWRRYSLSPDYGMKSSLQQQALMTAFTRSIEAGFASTVVSRATRSGSQSPHFGNPGELMDLLVFWQQQNSSNVLGMSHNHTLELPPVLSNIISAVPNCKVSDEGCWEKGMSYAARCLLMKATNCLVQAQLARSGYHRIGRYFVRTLDEISNSNATGCTAESRTAGEKSNLNTEKPSHTVAFTLNYFVHSDGRQLCAFVNGRRRPPLARLSFRHLANGAQNTNVLLCPFGLSGRLTGKALTGSEASELLNLFAHTCPVVPQQSDPNDLPSVVEVAIAGGLVHTWYPTHSLLVVENSDRKPSEAAKEDQSTQGSFQHSSPQHQPGRDAKTGSPMDSDNPTSENLEPIAINILQLMSSSSDITTHPSVLPTPNCACSVSLTGKRTSTTTSSHSSAKRPSFHRSCHQKSEEVIPSPMASFSQQKNDDISTLFPPLSIVAPVTGATAAAEHATNDATRSMLSGKTGTDSMVDSTMKGTRALNNSGSAVTNELPVSTAGPTVSLSNTSTNNVPVQSSINGNVSPMELQPPDIVPRKLWPSQQNREMLQRASLSFSSSKTGGFMFGKNFQNSSKVIKNLSSPPFSKCTTGEDLVSLFGFDSLSCSAIPSPVKIYSVTTTQQCHNPLAETEQPLINHHSNRHHGNISKSHLAVLLDSPGPEMSEPLSVDKNRGDAAALDILATIGNSNKGIGAMLPDNIFDVDSDGSDGAHENSPSEGGQVSGPISAPNSLDAHFPTPPTSVETNAPPSLRGLTPAAAQESDQQQHQAPALWQQTLNLSLAKPIAALDDPFAVCETVFSPLASCAFIEGEKYRPLVELAIISSNTDELVSLGNSTTQVSLKSLRHEPARAKSRTGTPMKPLQPQQEVVREVESPLAFLNGLMAGEYNTGEFPKSPIPMTPSKNFVNIVPETLVSLLLHMSDSVIDIYRDANFDMAPLCACTNSALRGVDWPAYLRANAEPDEASVNGDNFGGPDAGWSGPIAECSCGYSAVLNRRFASYGCGLLRDDEKELISSNASLKAVSKYARFDSSYKNLDFSVIKLFQKLCSVAGPPVPIVAHLAESQQVTTAPWTGTKRTPVGFLKRMAVADRNSSLPMCRCRTCFAEAIENNTVFVTTLNSLLDPDDELEDIEDADCFFFHNWLTCGACNSSESFCSNLELFRVLASIHPVIVSTFRSVEATPAPRNQRDLLFGGDSKGGIPAQAANAGPLQLVSLFESGSEHHATAVPIPFVMTSCEKEAIQLAPSALGPCWEKNALEPVAGSGRRMCYFSIQPTSLGTETSFEDEEQNETTALKYLIGEVGRVMVDCRLASLHTALVETSSPFAQKVPRLPVRAGSYVEGSPLLYANALRDWIRTVSKMVTECLSERDRFESYDGCICYVAVRDQGIACQVLQVFSHLLDQLPSDDYRDRVAIQLVPTSYAALAWSEGNSLVQTEIRRMAFSIYTQIGSRWKMDRGERALTDTGPLPLMRDIVLTETRLALLANPDRKPIKYSPENATGLWDGPLRWPNSPIVVLARMKDQQTRLAECCGQKADPTIVVFAAYCPTPDQRYIIVSLSDDCGYIVKTGVLALEQGSHDDQRPPSRQKARARRLRPPSARAVVGRVWCWLQGAISHSCLAVPIRLVLTRLGRMGHGEARTWSSLLSRQNLMNTSSRLQGACNHCQALPAQEVPCVISSCLISLEPHPWLRLLSSNESTPVATSVQQSASLIDFGNAYSSGSSGEFRSAGKLLTSTGSAMYSSTHVFAFPTSASIQANTQTVAGEVQDGDEWDNLFPSDFDNEILRDMPPVGSPTGGSGLFDELGLQLNPPGQQPPSRLNNASDTWTRPSSSGETGGLANMLPGATANFFGVDTSPGGPGVSGGTCLLLQQPLAVAYIVSSAPIGPALPEWLNTIMRDAGINQNQRGPKRPTIEANRPTSEADRPTALRATLHVHTASICPTTGGAAGAAGLGSSGPNGAGGSSVAHGAAGAHGAVQEHPLDSRRTVDVLRYAVEEHDSLSWLGVDPSTGQRLSCLPPHIVALVNLHHLLLAFSR